MLDYSIAAAIERYPLADALGRQPYAYDESTTPPTQEENTSWVPTYDLNAAAADIWEEIAAGYVGEFDFSTTDQRFDRSQKHAQAMKQVRYYRSRRVPTSIVTTGVAKQDTGRADSYIINLPEEDD